MFYKLKNIFENVKILLKGAKKILLEFFKILASGPINQ